MERVVDFLKKPFDSGKGKSGKSKKRAQKGSKTAKKRGAGGATSYILYSNEHREEVTAANPGLKMTEISKLIGDKWKKESQAVRDEWSAKALKMRAEKKLADGDQNETEDEEVEDDEDQEEDEQEQEEEEEEEEEKAKPTKKAKSAPKAEGKAATLKRIEKLVAKMFDSATEEDPLSKKKVRQILVSEHDFSEQLIEDLKVEIDAITTKLAE